MTRPALEGIEVTASEVPRSSGVPEGRGVLLPLFRVGGIAHAFWVHAQKD